MQSSDTVVASAGEFRANDDISIGTRTKKIVTSVHKEPVYRLVCGMFSDECRKVAQAFPDVTLTEVLVDGFAMKVVMNPHQYDAVVTTNQFGNVLTDLGAGLVGGLGLAPGLVCGERQALAQATHGSAPDIAGKNIANPSLCADYVGADAAGMAGARKRNEAKAVEAARLIDAMEKVIAEVRHLTPDLGGKASTAEMGNAVAAAV